ncbi:MAG TPA: hypothetical protein VMH83_05300 [Candidatus Acidoferrum sp.]|nr:hypothetical protein [Candidatus Acidoferrum sp.]
MSTLLEVYDRLGASSAGDTGNADGKLVLDHEQRDKGRLKTQTSDGRTVGLFLERGTPLSIGEMLLTQCGKHLIVEGAPEPVVTARCDDWGTFSRACYHLGNRHVKIQLGERWLRILPDHVLEDLLQRLGLCMEHEVAVFIPEGGAYGHHHH